MFEGGVRSPSMVKWPAKVAAGRVSDYQWAFWDLMPTLAEMAGGKAAADAVPKDIDGVSFLSELVAKDTNKQEDDGRGDGFLYWTGKNGWGDPNAPLSAIASAGGDGHKGSDDGTDKVTAYAIRSGQWKLVVNACTNGKPAMSDVAQLYDLSTDPFEVNDLAGTPGGQARVKMMKQMVLDRGVSCRCFQC